MHSGAEASSSSWLCVVVKHQTLPEDQMPFLLLTPLWVCQRVSPAPFAVPGAAGMWSRSSAKHLGGGINP